MCSMFGCESQLEKLEDTVSTIKALLLDVDSKRQGLTHEGQVWVEKLKDAVYDVDDLLDEFTTIAQQHNQMRDAKFSKKVSHFFSHNNKFFVAFNVSREIKLLREKLDAIAKNHADFGFTDVNKPVKRREETCSNISELDVIGREDEKEVIVGVLLSDSHSSYQNVSFVNIVGIGGLGKTTLAQLVYNDDRIKKVFSKRIWVCVSEEFGVREILGKMLGKEELTLEEMQRKVRTTLERKRFLLVLDDVWNEDHEKWFKLRSFLVSDVSGSKIIVTSRSKKVARAIGESSMMYELRGLSDENSWRLFKRVAFTQGEDQADFIEIGQDIVKKCANVPLCIRVIGSLLYDQDESKWLWFRSIDLADMSDDEGYIMSTLMFSYYHLTPKLKSCFSFCSLFPKDYVIQRKLLINLWLAQGLLVTTHQLQSIEDVALEMLPNTITKLHNLQILKLCRCMNLKELPDDTSKLVNLRTLDISGCDKLTHMPRGVSNLKNLHMLPQFVVGGVDLKQIRGSKLVDLKALTGLKGDLCIRVRNFSSNNVSHVSKRAFILKDAHIKNLEIRCGGQYRGQSKPFLRTSRKRDDGFGQSHVHETVLEDLCPNHDVSRITMVGYEGTKIPSWASMMVSVNLSDIDGLQCLTSLSRLCHLKNLKLQDLCNVEYIETDAPSVLVSRARESMTFFPVLKELVLDEMPKLKGWWSDIKWMEMEGGGGYLVDAKGEQALISPSFPSLNVLIIKDCWSMTYFPPCPHVKTLDVQGVNDALTFCMKGGIVPSAVMCRTGASTSWSLSSSVSVSLCLEKLKINNARALNSLFREFVEGAVDIEMSLVDKTESMGIVREGFQRCAPSLKHLLMYCFEVKSLRGGIEHLTNLQSLKIEHSNDLDMEDEEEEGMPWKCLCSLSSLTLISLRKMVNLPKGFKYLTSLQSLHIENCYNLEKLGECLDFLTSLQVLQIMCCPQLKSLPESMCHLTSLTTLDIYNPSHELKERCQEPNGQDWPNFFVNFTVSREIKLLRERLEAINLDNKDYGLITNISNIQEVKTEVLDRETSSNTDPIVIGRDSDKKAVVDMLLSDSNQTCQNVSYVNIVGIGGLGKTTLAQLVYNDERVKGAFSERIWVCVSDKFCPKEILESIRIRHLSREYRGSNIYLSGTLRTYIWFCSYLINGDSSQEELDSIIYNCTRLRVLSLCNFVLATVPRNLGELLHLRYLDLSDNWGLEMLPKSITKLYNLQILKLSQCIDLKGLPKDLSKLVNLRTLDIHNCVALTHMPRGMSNLTNLHTLTQFVVGGVDLKQTQGSKLLDLHALPSLEGDLRIRIRDFCSNNMPHATERVFLLKDARLRSLDIRCGTWYSDEILDPCTVWRSPSSELRDIDQSGVHEILVEDLCPNDDIRRIGMVGYKGTKMPSWASMMAMTDIDGVQHVTSLSLFRHLKVVTLDDLPNVEYIESDAAWASVSSFNVSRTTFFLSLEKLVLKRMPKLKGWWRDVKLGEGGGLIDARGDVPMDHVMHLPSFPRLHELRIEGCYSMTYFPPCPHVKRLHLMGVNDALAFFMKGAAYSSSNVLVSLCLDKLEVNNGRVFNSILRDGFVGGAVDIELTCDKAMKSLGSVKEGFERCTSSLQHLLIRSWREMNVWSIDDTPYDHDHDVLEEVEEGMPWKYMQSVCSLELSHFPKMVKLPKGLKYLTSLQTLCIRWCPNFEELGESMRFLTSLQSLDVINSDK
ncbi:putative disease resistance protein RGA3, partial [Bienertia sinuspersici]